MHSWITRVEAPEESDDPNDRPPIAALSRAQPTWVLRSRCMEREYSFDSKKTWYSSGKDWPVKQRDAMLLAGHIGWRNARQLDPIKGYPEVRYAMLHIFSPSFDPGISFGVRLQRSEHPGANLSDSNPDDPMAAVLLYTAAADSDGILGGLVELENRDLGRLIKQALRRATICSSDPHCSEHNASTDRTLHGASCHACGFIAETSCERGNRYLVALYSSRPSIALTLGFSAIYINERARGSIARIAMEMHPERIEAICSALEGNRGSTIVSVVERILGNSFSSDLVQAFRAALRENERVTVW